MELPMRRLLSTQESNTVVIHTDLVELGYWPEIYRVDSSDYGVPQGRVRVYIVAVRKDIQECLSIDKDSFFRKCTSDMQTLCHTCPDIYECILPSTDEAVQNELIARNMKVAAEANPAHQNWPQTHMEFLYNQGNLHHVCHL